MEMATLSAEGAGPNRRYSRKTSIVIDAQDRVLASSERKFSISGGTAGGSDSRRGSLARVQYRKSDGGIENIAFDADVNHADSV